MRLTSVLNISHITQPRFPAVLPYYYATKAIYAEQAVVLPHSSQMLDQGAMYGSDCAAEFRQASDMLFMIHF